MKSYVELTKKEQLWKNNYEKNGGVKTTLDYFGWLMVLYEKQLELTPWKNQVIWSSRTPQDLGWKLW